MKTKTIQSNRLAIILFAMLFTTLTATAQETIKVRGTSTDSLTNTINPLVIIDGVESASINSISPDMVESMTILKDASATAIYGEKAKNGVILVVTKAGAAEFGTNAQQAINANEVTVVGYGTLKNSLPVNGALIQAEVMPKFNGSSDVIEFSKWAQKNVIYPQDASANGIQGRVMIQFIVNKEGKVVNVAILRGVNKSLNDAAIKVIESSPEWTPGENKGQKVDVSFTIPIEFKLS